MAEEAKVKLRYVSVGCNKLANCASWGSNGLLAYGASRFVALYSAEQYQVIATLRGHKDRVNVVKWLNENELISGSSDSTLLTWERGQDNIFRLKSKLPPVHKGSITSLDVVIYPDSEGKALVVATSVDKTISVYIRNSQTSDWELHQHESLAGEAVECCALYFLPESKQQTPILALGGVGGSGSCRGSQILLYLLHSDPEKQKQNFKYLVTLKGHEDWVRCLSFTSCEDGSILLASSAQDNYIRLWKIEAGKSNEKEPTEQNSLFAAFSSLSLLESIGTASISQQGHTFEWDQQRYCVVLESVLYGHEDWVYSVNWHPPIRNAQGKLIYPACLLSSSMDKTMMIWRPCETEGGVWLNEIRVGELGGNTLGFYGGLFSPDGNFILAHGYNGAFHLWKKSFSNDSQESWTPEASVSGHFASVNDCCWDPSSQYFLTVSQDQTARIFTTRTRESDKADIFFEIARPQIHGYDLECGCFIRSASHRFVTGAEEKIFRVFDAPSSFIHNFQKITGKKIEEENIERPLGANVPTLGLSNKPIFTLEEKVVTQKVDENDPFEMPKAADPVFIQRPPFEEELIQSTLWPEIQKLYGHGNYTFCITSSTKGNLIATAVHAKSDPEQASIRLWDTNSWKEVANLPSHKLTVTQLRFSNSDQYLLSVGRDRLISVFQRSQDDNGAPFTLLAKVPKAHERLLWGCDWSPDDRFFITGSRDKICKLWSIDEGKVLARAQFNPAKTPVTAVAFAPIVLNSNSYIVAIGYENGLIQVWKIVDGPEISFALAANAPAEDCHADTVKKISWRPLNQNGFQFVSCSADHSVRVFDVDLANQ